MLIDKEPDELGELEVEEQKNELPEKYRTKSLEEIVRMHQEAEKLIGKQAQVNINHTLVIPKWNPYPRLIKHAPIFLDEGSNLELN